MSTQQIIKCDICGGTGHTPAGSYKDISWPREKCWKCKGYRRLVVCSCGCGATLPDDGCDETGRPMR